MGAQGNVKAGPSRLRNTACVVRTALAVTLGHGSPGTRCPHTQELDVPGPCEGGDAPFNKGRWGGHPLSVLHPQCQEHGRCSGCR